MYYMKYQIYICVIVFFVITCLARITLPFNGWYSLEEQSPVIVVVRCGSPTPSQPGVLIMNGARFNFAVEVISVLKGTNILNQAKLYTNHDLTKGEDYLVFGYYDSGIFNAYEKYRVISLGRNFPVNTITGKPLKDQLRVLFQRRVDNLAQQIQQEETEKRNLEEGIKLFAQ